MSRDPRLIVESRKVMHAPLLALGVAHTVTHADLTFDRAGTQSLPLDVPRLDGMDEIVVERARLDFTAATASLPSVNKAANSATSSLTLALPSGTRGSLVSVVIRDLAVIDSIDRDKAISISDGHIYYGWANTKDDDGNYAIRPGSGDGWGAGRLRILVSPADGPPARAVPYMPMVGNAASLYPSGVLGGLGIGLDQPAKSAITLTLAPVLDASSIKITLGIDPDDGPLVPNNLTLCQWTASSVAATWVTRPRDVAINASAAGEQAVVGNLPGELPARAVTLDFTPAARSLLNGAYQKGAPSLSLSLESKSAGILHRPRLSLSASYRRALVPREGQPVQLRGDPATVELALPGPYVPQSLELTVDGRFGLGVLAQAADSSPAAPHVGVRLAGTVWLARRIALARHERNLRLLRVGVLGRATGATELLVSLHKGDDTYVGARLGQPQAIAVAPSLAPAWHRAELPDDPSLLPNPEAVWVVARASRGVFWWYADAKGGAPVLVSPDGGATWSAGEGRPSLQLHVQSKAAEPEKLSLSWNHGEASADLLQESAARSRVEMSALQAAGMGLRASSSAPDDPAKPRVTGSTAPGDGDAASFRKEGLQPFDAAERDRFADLGKTLTLAFDCRRDVDFKLLAATATYAIPWK